MLDSLRAILAEGIHKLTLPPLAAMELPCPAHPPMRNSHQQIGITAVTARLPCGAFVGLDTALGKRQRLSMLIHSQPAGDDLVDRITVTFVFDRVRLGDEFFVCLAGVFVVLLIEGGFSVFEGAGEEGGNE